ncbi:prominin-2-like isoform X2 [Urocitellus parryii]
MNREEPTTLHGHFTAKRPDAHRGPGDPRLPRPLPALTGRHTAQRRDAALSAHRRRHAEARAAPPPSGAAGPSPAARLLVKRRAPALGWRCETRGPRRSPYRVGRIIRMGHRFADTPGNLPPSLNLSHLLGMRKNVSVLLTYQQCREGAALWKVLQLDDSYNLEKHLDLSQQNLQNFKPNVQNLELLSPEAHRDLEALQSSGLEKVNYQAFRVQIQSPVVKTDLEQLAQELQGLAQAQGNSSLGQQLRMEAHGLRDLSGEGCPPAEPGGTAQPQRQGPGIRCPSSSGGRRGWAWAADGGRATLQTAGVLSHVADLERELPARAARILMNESACFLSRELSYFSQYLAWVREEVTQRIATCQPLSAALDNGRVILCDMVADPWNAFWFCLAWCTFFLIPSVVFAVKTSKYFRPIRKRLSSTSSEETQLFHIPRVTSLKL